MSRVMIVDDEENIRVVLRTLLRQRGYEVDEAASAETALERIETFSPDALFVDVRMPGLSGIELCRELQQRLIAATVIVMSAYGSHELALEAIKAGAYDYISKPFRPDDVLLVLRKAEERQALQRENRALRSALDEHGRLDDMLGRSTTMRALFRMIRKVAAHKTTILIQGESGTGKELVARALHRLSPRKEGPWVAVNCGAIPHDLLESELFGYVRGAFTHAHRDKQGLFAAAHRGTLFLDEVGELPLLLQVKLLRALQEEQVRPVGATKSQNVDIRLIAATVQDLPEQVKTGAFREDLFYRLNVVTVQVPALRERREDIPLLLEHIIHRNNAKLSLSIQGLSAGARRLLLDYNWPGNVRELENVVERAMVLCESDRIEERDLPERIRAFHSALNDSTMATEGNELSELSIKQATRSVEERLIRRALLQTRGNRTAASRLLEISHRALLYKIKEYGIA